VAGTYNNMAVVYQSQGHYERALEYYQKSLDITIKVVGHDHPRVADSKVNIGLVYEKTGRKSEAKTLFTEAAKIRRNKLGPDHPLTKKAERLAAK
jgi:tetratricopeptide (TPR) repeat protein